VVLERTQTLKSLHPLAWWAWAIGIGIAVNGTTNPLLLALIALALVWVVLLRRSSAPWARSVRAYLILGGFVIAMRVFFQIVIGAKTGDTILFALPEIPLPDWAAGIRLGGPITAEALAYTINDALRLAVLLLCLGAANALANPRQALRSMPAALYEASAAVVVALSVAPQLIESGQRVLKARRTRGTNTKGLRSLASVILPVMADSIERSMSLAAGMEARGFARTRGLPVRGSLTLMISSSMLATLGAFVLLSTDFRLLAVGCLVIGLVGAGFGLRLAGKRLAVTRYRQQPWRVRDTVVSGFGLLAAVVVLTIGGLNPNDLSASLLQWLDPQALFPSTDPLTWPQLSVPMLLVVGLVAAPLAVTGKDRIDVTESVRNDTMVRSLRPKAEILVTS
jgi:energy-coupling factor transport system permease protein